MLVYFSIYILLNCCFQGTKAMQFGPDANAGQFKYKALIYMDGDYENYCQGATISVDWVITTARFLYKNEKKDMYSKYQMNIGLNNRKEGKYKLTINNKDIHIHPDYDFDLDNDIALIKTPQTLKRGDSMI